MSDGTFKVTCAHCQRSYTWKKELAGKRGKCKCGQVLVMPPAPPRAESPDDLFALAELASDAKSAAVDRPAIAIPVAAVAENGGAIPVPMARSFDYHRPYSNEDTSGGVADRLTDSIRDIYVPMVMFAAGVAAALIWVFTQTKAGTPAPVLAAFLTWMLRLVDDAIPIALALWAATRFGVGFGSLGSTLLKFGAIATLIVSAELWLPNVLKATGAMSDSGQAPWFYIVLLSYCLATTFMAIACLYLFRMDINDVAMFAITYLVIGVIFDLAVALAVVVVAGMVHAKTIGAAPASAPLAAVAIVTAGSPAATSAAPAAMVSTFFDQVILRRIHQQLPVQQVFEGNQWKQSFRYMAADKLTGGLIDRLYAAGAVKVYIDTNGGLHPLAYAELPLDNNKRVACADVASAYRRDNGLRPESAAAANLTRQFLIIPLKK
ncbi:MAG TPA: hypothetical protein VHX86_13290 [Tepidisphaeraceae bacterium]|jgi:hypothetical protein|nr:hypothetical protein [Tepidisphaeraceae bacterium]